MEMAAEGPVQLIAVDRIQPGRFQPRRAFSEAEIEELAESIRLHGVLQPLVVRPADGMFELVAGERRWRAARAAGLARVPAVVRDVSDEEAAVLALVENLQREGLHFLEEAQAYERLIKEFGFTQEEVARQVARSQASVANRLRLLRLDDDVKAIISREMVSERHARALLKLPSGELQRLVVMEVVRKGLTVRETEKLVERVLADTGNGASEGGGGQSVIGALKDIRIVVNNFRETVGLLRENGIPAVMDVVGDENGGLEIRIRIPKVDGVSAKKVVSGWRPRRRRGYGGRSRGRGIE